MDPSLQEVVRCIESSQFGDSRIFAPLINTLTHGKDYYLISDDFESYLNAQNLVDESYKDQEEWIKKSILCTANMGKFSSYVSEKIFLIIINLQKKFFIFINLIAHLFFIVIALSENTQIKYGKFKFFSVYYVY